MESLKKTQSTKRNSSASPGLRKPLIAGVIVFCLIITVWAVIESLSGNNQNNKQAVVTASNGEQVAPAASINELPGSYGSEKFQHFIKPPEPKQSVSAEEINDLKDQLASLRSDYQNLQNQLVEQQNNNDTVPPETSKNGSLTESQQQQAMQSPIFMPVAFGYNDSNTNNKKNDNDNNSDNVNDDVISKVKYPKSPNVLLSGSSIPAVLQTEVVSDVPGTVVGIVRQNVYDSIHGTHVLIPKGTRLIGSYYSGVSYGQGSLQVNFRRLIRPDGSSIDLGRFPGTSPKGTSGMAEEVNNHWGSIIGATLLSSIFSIPSILASNSQYTSSTCVIGKDANGNAIYGDCGNQNGNNLKNAGLQSIGRAAARIGSRVTDRALSRRPTVLIHPGYTFNVLVVKDLVLPPYVEK